MNSLKWQIKSRCNTDMPKVSEIVDILLKNRGIEGDIAEKEFFNPTHPKDISISDFGIEKLELKKALNRIKKAIEKKEKIIVYGDYDVDGVTGTAILWETLWSLKADVLPYLPDRFSEGYGLKETSIAKLKSEYPNLGLIITVDNGIVSEEKIAYAKELKIDTIVTDHHEKSDIPPNSAVALVYTQKVSGAGVAWILSREIQKTFSKDQQLITKGRYSGLELAAIGIIADQVPLIGVARNIVKHGLVALHTTTRPGLLALFQTAGIKQEDVGTYEINYVVAPRINAMGRLTHAIDSLRLLCTKDRIKAAELAQLLQDTNIKRQQTVESVLAQAKSVVDKNSEMFVVVLAGEYHEGVIGLAAAKLVEEFWRPAIVLSKKGDISKASARSIPGFNIIEAIRSAQELLIEGGGHAMAAGFSIKTQDISHFSQLINEFARKKLTDEILEKHIHVDCEINLESISQELVDKIKDFEPFGIGNPAPSFVSRKAVILDVRTVGSEAKHLKLRFKLNSGFVDAIAFGLGPLRSELPLGKAVDIVYGIEMNEWNGSRSLQIKIKDIDL